MANKRKATVKATKQEVEVYKLMSGSKRNGDWCDFADCGTIYKEEELTFNK